MQPLAKTELVFHLECASKALCLPGNPPDVAVVHCFSLLHSVRGSQTC